MRYLCGALALLLGHGACGPSSPAGDSSTDGGDLEAADAASPHDARPRPDAASCQEGVDVVFVLDVSSSMNFVLTDLEANIGSVVDAANGLAPGAHFGLIAFADNYRLDDTGSAGAIHTETQSLVDAFANYRSVYTANNRNPGDGPTGPTTQNPICEENALDSLYAAAAEFPWRDDAAHVVIVATDDTFLENPDDYGDANADGDFDDDFPFNEDSYPALRTVAETTTALTDAEVRVFAFTRSTPPNFLERCGTERRLPWDDITNGWSAPYAGQPAFPEATDGRNYDLAAVQAGSLSLAETISEVVLESHCNPIE